MERRDDTNPGARCRCVAARHLGERPRTGRQAGLGAIPQRRAQGAPLFRALAGPGSPVLDVGTIPWPLFACGFCLAEVYAFHLQFRGETHTFTLNEILLVLGLFIASPACLLGAQLLGAAVALFAYTFRGQRAKFWERMTLTGFILGNMALANEADLRRMKLSTRDVVFGLGSAALLYQIFEIGDRFARSAMPRGSTEIRDIYALRTIAPYVSSFTWVSSHRLLARPAESFIVHVPLRRSESSTAISATDSISSFEKSPRTMRYPSRQN